jgi:hypothetical protein
MRTQRCRPTRVRRGWGGGWGSPTWSAGRAVAQRGQLGCFEEGSKASDEGVPIPGEFGVAGGGEDEATRA